MKKVFVSGTAGFGMGKDKVEKLPSETYAVLDDLINTGAIILIGDCQGTDTLVQKYINSKRYFKVFVFHIGAKPRNCINSEWETKRVSTQLSGRAAFSEKDKEMIRLCDEAVAIWDGSSIGTYNNILDCRSRGKKITVIPL